MVGMTDDFNTTDDGGGEGGEEEEDDANGVVEAAAVSQSFEIEAPYFMDSLTHSARSCSGTASF